MSQIKLIDLIKLTGTRSYAANARQYPKKVKNYVSWINFLI